MLALTKISYRVSGLAVQERLVFSRFLRLVVGFRKYEKFFFNMSETICREAAGLMRAGTRGKAGGFLLSPHELDKAAGSR